MSSASTTRRAMRCSLHALPQHSLNPIPQCTMWQPHPQCASTLDADSHTGDRAHPNLPHTLSCQPQPVRNGPIQSTHQPSPAPTAIPQPNAHTACPPNANEQILARSTQPCTPLHAQHAPCVRHVTKEPQHPVHLTKQQNVDVLVCCGRQAPQLALHAHCSTPSPPCWYAVGSNTVHKTLKLAKQL